MTKDEMIEFLWQIIDDIDTASDWAKSNDVAYRKAVEKIQKRRWETGITTDGYTLTIPEETKTSTSAIYCEHANEMPAQCPCPDDCYCKAHSCKGR